MFEKKQEAVVSTHVFVRRLFGSLLLSAFIMALALLLGVLGYHHFEGLGWIDSLLNAAMILGGMGPVNTLTNDSAKLFASFYALFSGVIFISTMGIILAPVFHRVMHKFHMDEDDLNN